MANDKKLVKRAIEGDLVVSNVLGKPPHEPLGDIVCVGGFIGESPRADHVRLFIKIDFSQCLDIPNDNIVGMHKVQKEGIPEGTYVWIKRSAQIGYTAVDPVDGQSTFLQGAILRSNPAVAAKMRARGQDAGIWSTPICSVIVVSLVSVATVTFLICSRVDCGPDYTDIDVCPDPPEPVSVIA
jgi:hypothetical protein